MKNKIIILFAVTVSFALSCMPLSSANALSAFFDSDSEGFNNYIDELTDIGYAKLEIVHPFNEVLKENDDSKIEVYGSAVNRNNPSSVYNVLDGDRWEISCVLLRSMGWEAYIKLNPETKNECLEFIQENYADLTVEYDEDSLRFKEQSEDTNFINSISKMIIDLTDDEYCVSYSVYGDVYCMEGVSAMLNRYSNLTIIQQEEIKNLINSEGIKGTWVEEDSTSGYIQYDEDVTSEEVLLDTDMIYVKTGACCDMEWLEDGGSTMSVTYDIDSYMSILRAESSEDKTVNPVTTNTAESTDSATTITTKAIKGDINNDNQVNSIDAVFVLKDYASQILGNKTTLDLSTADMNDDGKINSSDAVIILKQYAQSLISK
jgi:hypothetical protein